MLRQTFLRLSQNCSKKNKTTKNNCGVTKKPERVNFSVLIIIIIIFLKVNRIFVNSNPLHNVGVAVKLEVILPPFVVRGLNPINLATHGSALKELEWLHFSHASASAALHTYSCLPEVFFPPTHFIDFNSVKEREREEERKRRRGRKWAARRRTSRNTTRLGKARGRGARCVSTCP